MPLQTVRSWTSYCLEKRGLGKFVPSEVQLMYLKDFNSDDVYLEAQIQNITPGPIYLERIPLEPSSLYTVKEFVSDCNIVSKDDKSSLSSSLRKTNYLGALDICQFLYSLTPRTDTGADLRNLKGVINIGKLDIIWKTSMGEKGRLQTSPLQRVAPGSGDVKLTVEDIPQVVHVDSIFQVKLRVTNCCERTMDIELSTVNNPSTGLLWTGVSGRSLGKVESYASLALDLSIVAIRTGLLTLSGLRLTDTFLKRTYEHDEVAQVFIYDDE